MFVAKFEFYGKTSEKQMALTIPVEALGRIKQDIKLDRHEQTGDQFTLFFQLYERRMKTTVTAATVTDAMAVVRSKVIVRSVVPQSEDAFKKLFGDNDIFDKFKDIFGK